MHKADWISDSMIKQTKNYKEQFGENLRKFSKDFVS